MKSDDMTALADKLDTLASGIEILQGARSVRRAAASLAGKAAAALRLAAQKPDLSAQLAAARSALAGARKALVDTGYCAADAEVVAIDAALSSLAQEPAGQSEAKGALMKFADDVREIVDQCQKDFHRCEQCGHQDDLATETSNIYLLLQESLAALSAHPTVPAGSASPGETAWQSEWRDGAPPKPWADEWFIAETTYGYRVVLRSLPEEFTYDFKTADDTYIKADRIKRWMQFPDSQFIAPTVKVSGDAAEMREALKPFASAAHAFARTIPDNFELLVKIDATPMFTLKVGDLRRAREVIEREPFSPIPPATKATLHRDVLKFYADLANWRTPSRGFAAQYDPEPSAIDKDKGERARKAIGGGTP